MRIVYRPMTCIATALVFALTAGAGNLPTSPSPSPSPQPSSGVSLSPASLSFSSTTVGVTSGVEYSTLTNTGSSALTFSDNLAISGPFALGDLGSCVSTVASGASCTISVVSKPTAAGTAAGAVTLADNAGTQTLALKGSRGASATGSSNYYVSSAGSDSSGNGSQSHPWATISHASSHVGPGAVVHVQAGNYGRGVSTSTSGTSRAYITYEGDNSNWQPVNCAQIAADHGDLSQCPHLLSGWGNSGNYVKIQGFDVKGSGINAIYTQGNATIIVENHVHDTLNSTCNSMGGSGINLNGTNAQVIGNYVHNIGPYPSSCGFVQGIYFLKAGGFAYNNISFNNSGFGIQLWHYPAHVAVVNNTIFNNASGGIVMGTDDNFTVDYITVSNNIVAYNGGAGISEQGCCSTSVGSHITVTNNLLYQNGRSSTTLHGRPLGSLTIALHPEFSDYTGTAAGNYHLQSGSPAIGTATGTGAPATDFDGNARPQNGHYDIGAYEYVP